MRSSLLPSVLLFSGLWLGALPCSMAGDAIPKVQFNRDIRPILANNCYQCHGPDENHRKADLRLDSRQNAVVENQVIIPGKSEESELYLRLVTPELPRRMPPRKTKKTLKPAEIQLIKQWIDQGAEFQGHWAFLPPKRPVIPEVRSPEWTLTPIDRFILARLEQLGLVPSKRADKHALIRRVTFDLTGLPPTPEEVNDFLTDSSPQAFPRVVDRLLASPRFGEHMARFWLDAVRYGDTHGLHLDNYREMWAYRDWVISALNQNKGFDRFTIEQLAGDLLPNPATDQLIASGYNRAHVTTSEGGSIAEEVYVRNVIDRVSTTSTVWMGLTAGCAVCHDHKFDPLKQKELYQLFAFFNNLDGNPLDGNKKDPAPVLRVPTPAQKREIAMLRSSIAELQAQMKERKGQIEAAFEQWLQTMESRSKKTETVVKGLIAHYPLDEGKGSQVKSTVGEWKPGEIKGPPTWKSGKFGGALELDANRFVDLGNVADFERTQSFSYGAWIHWAGGGGGQAPLARMNDGNKYRGYDLYIANGQVAVHLIHEWPNRTLKVTTKTRIAPRKWNHLFVTYDGSSRPSGLKVYFNGKAQPFQINQNSLFAEIPKGAKAVPNTARTRVPFFLGRRNPGSHYRGLIDDVRIYDRQLSEQEVASLAGSDPLGPILAIPAAERTTQQKEMLRRHYLQQVDPVYRKHRNEVTRQEARIQTIERQQPTTLIMKERPAPREAFVLKRGAYDQRGEKVGRATPSFLPPLKKKEQANRLDFAQWLISKDHPLTARVLVNRLWQQLYGIGIVRTSEDFGIQGEWPSHSELLDWLAVQFREDNWDVKKLMRLLVLSATYQQSSRVTPELYRRDPENRLLARGPRFRLDAEMLRDQALAVSGLLVDELGGPSVKPPQPNGLWYAVGYTRSNTARFKQDNGSSIFRRSVYTFWKRTSPPPQMTTFDAPSRESCAVRRERTNTPLQALLLMNERQYVESARHLAARVLRKGDKAPEDHLKDAFLLATARLPEAMETEEMLSAYRDFLAELKANPQAAKELIQTGDTPPDPSLDPIRLATWTMMANLILNLDEVLNKE